MDAVSETIRKQDVALMINWPESFHVYLKRWMQVPCGHTTKLLVNREGKTRCDQCDDEYTAQRLAERKATA